MPARKRGRQEADLDLSMVEENQDNPTLQKLRNMWEFASLMQYIFFFGKVVKIDEDFDIEELETECLKPGSSEKLAQIGLALLKYVSSHRGLTPEIFDEYTRRQYLAKAPQRNPFGDEEEPNKFNDFDVFTKVRVLQQLSTWTFGNAERIRSMMPEKDSEQVDWRIDPMGWDAEDRSYFLMDDDRLYRRTDAPLPPTPKPKAKAKPKARKSRGTRSSKRRKLSTPESEAEENADAEGDENNVKEEEAETKAEDDTFGGMKWECIAITLEEYQGFLESIRKSRDPNEKALFKAVTEDVLPVIEKRAEAQRQKALKKQRELENLQKMATAKRSSRISSRLEKQKAEEEAVAAERKREEDLRMARKEQERQQKMEEARETRMLTREQRLKEREVKRILHEEELKKLEENSKNVEQNEARMSERYIKSEMERRQRELEKLAEEEDQWIFDCSVCGMHGENLDDGTHSIACERCNIWQHSKCHGIKQEQAERDDFHFICTDCKRKEEDAKKPKLPPLKFRVGGSASPQAERATPRAMSSDQMNGTPQPISYGATRPMDGGYAYHAGSGAVNQTPRRGSSEIMNGPALSPQGQSPGPPGHQVNGHQPVGVPQKPWQGTTLPPPMRPNSSGYASSPPPQQLREGLPGSPPTYKLHQQAHASAVASSNMSPHSQPYQSNGAPNGHYGMLPPSSPYKHSASRPTSSYDAQRQPSFTGPPSPSKPRTSASPPHSSPRLPQPGSYHQPHNLSFPPPQSPNTILPPPQNYQQHTAGYSPVKQPSSSPQHPYPQPHATPTHLPQGGQAATPQMHPHGTPLQPSPNFSHPGMASSPYAPVPPLSSGPVIPTKHDATPRPASSHSVSGTPGAAVAALSPSPSLAPGAAPPVAMQVGNIPVKRMPEQRPQEGQDTVMRDV